MTIWDKIKAYFTIPDDEPEVAATSGMVGRPMPATLSDAEKIKQAWYRLDAMKRYILQEWEENREVPDQKRAEFLEEFHQRVAFLLSKGQITPDEIKQLELIIG